MKPVSKIHQGKEPHHRHYIGEWLEERGMDPMDLLNSLNEADTSLPPVDKSQVYRWLKGQLPQPHMQARVAGALSILDPETGEPDPEGILRDPHIDWVARRLKGRSRDDIERVKQAIDLVLPPKTGTRN